MSGVVNKQALYERDEMEWADDQITALREGRLNDLDTRNLADFLSEMTKSHDRELKNRLEVLMAHLLKILIQPEHLSKSWINTILVQQRRIGKILEDHPSMKRKAQPFLLSVYKDAVGVAARETGIPLAGFPGKPPWDFGDVMSYIPPSLD